MIVSVKITGQIKTYFISSQGCQSWLICVCKSSSRKCVQTSREDINDTVGIVSNAVVWIVK